MVDAYTLAAQSLGISIWVVVALVIWEGIWTAIAMWKSARNKHLFWFIIFFLINLFGIPEIIYIFITKKKRKSSGKSKKK